MGRNVFNFRLNRSMKHGQNRIQRGRQKRKILPKKISHFLTTRKRFDFRRMVHWHTQLRGDYAPIASAAFFNWSKDCILLTKYGSSNIFLKVLLVDSSEKRLREFLHFFNKRTKERKKDSLWQSEKKLCIINRNLASCQF